jgi:hypothetical protein
MPSFTTASLIKRPWSQGVSWSVEQDSLHPEGHILKYSFSENGKGVRAHVHSQH